MRTIVDADLKSVSLVSDPPPGSTFDRCPTCYQLLVTCLGCGRHRGAWKDPTSRADYCSPRCRATAKMRRHRRRTLTQA